MGSTSKCLLDVLKVVMHVHVTDTKRRYLVLITTLALNFEIKESGFTCVSRYYTHTLSLHIVWGPDNESASPTMYLWYLAIYFGLTKLCYFSEKIILYH